MVSYENFIVPDLYYDTFLKLCRIDFVNEYYKNNKRYPSSSEIEQIILNSKEKDSLKRRLYNEYCVTGKYPNTNITPNTPPPPSIQPEPDNENETFNDIPNNEIRYTTHNNEMLNPYSLRTGISSTNAFSAKLLQNTYENGVGIMKFDTDVTLIDNYAFYEDENLKTIILPATIETFGGTSFSKTGIEEIIFHPNSQIESINGFNSCKSLKKLNIPSIKIIGNSAFAGCENLNEIILPEEITEIKPLAFAGCRNVNSLTIKAENAPIIYDSTFENFGTNNDVNYLYIPKNAIGYFDKSWANILLDDCKFSINYF